MDLDSSSLSSARRTFKKSSGDTSPPEGFTFWASCEWQKIIWSQIQIAAPHRLPVLIVGESGTGKEIIARELWAALRSHKSFSMADAPFNALNAAAIPKDLSESLLFGHERGAFTSARDRQYGRFELARKGTLFIDEIQCLEISVQAKLLRVLESKTFEPLGSRESKILECQIVAASNIPLEILVERGLFRQDLYYRLSLLQIFLPPLREQLSALSEICEKMLKKVLSAHRLQKKLILTPEVVEIFQNHNWPGNLRELEHTLLYAALHAPELEIRPEHLPPRIGKEWGRILERGNWK